MKPLVPAAPVAPLGPVAPVHTFAPAAPSLPAAPASPLAPPANPRHPAPLRTLRAGGPRPPRPPRLCPATTSTRFGLICFVEVIKYFFAAYAPPVIANTNANPATTVAGLTRKRLRMLRTSVTSPPESRACRRPAQYTRNGLNYEKRGVPLHVREIQKPSPRRGREPAMIRCLDQGRYWDKRERERERCVSAADASTNGPVQARSNPRHVCPQRTHAKTTPSSKRSRSLSKETLL